MGHMEVTRAAGRGPCSHTWFISSQFPLQTLPSQQFKIFIRVETRSVRLEARFNYYLAKMPSKTFLLLMFATLLVMAMLVEPSLGRDLMKKKNKKNKKGGKKKGGKNKNKGSGKGKTPSAPKGTGISAAMIKSKGYVLVGNSVFDISSFRHPGGSIINTCKGKDCTSLYNANHNSGALSKANKYKVGTYGK